MRALRFHAAQDLRLEEVATPPRPTGTQVLVAPVRVGICGTDVHEYHDGPQRTIVEPHPITGGHIPQILGHEFAATVVDVGPEAQGATAGQRVSIMGLRGCGVCSVCRAGHQHLCDLRASVGLRHPWGGMAELALVDDFQVSVMPDELSWEQGAMIEPAAVSWNAVQIGGVRAGQSVVVTGFGPIGALAALAATAEDAEVLVSEPNPARAAQAQALGFATIDPLAGEFSELVRATFVEGADAVIECSGVQRAIQDSLGALKGGGILVQTGVPVTTPTLDLRSLMLRGLRISGSVGFPVDCWPTVMGLVASGRYPVEKILSGTVPFDDQLPRVFERLLDPAGDELKVIIEVGAA
jgi:(R,R)-butanediol dehydrogenase/meso-butanediol dehydrogenase/diacetyl reductase